MKVLWISNIVFPEALSLIGDDCTKQGVGGWLLGAADALSDISSVDLCVVSVSKRISNLVYLRGDRINYYLIPLCKSLVGYNTYMRLINEQFSPDIVHIHGTEFPYGLSWLNVCPSENVVISIQGLVSIIAKYYLSGLTLSKIIGSVTAHDLMRKTIFGERRDLIRKGKEEEEVIKKVKYVIGRTVFDYSHCKAINPNIRYFHCNETLRSAFYSGRWEYKRCIPHSIFLSQGSSPIKGLHIVLKAISLIKNNYPDIRLSIAGKDYLHYKGITKLICQTGYEKIISKLVRKLRIANIISFTGTLDANGMKDEYLKANVFICPSSIENSSNSIGEAQLLGVPVIASFAGGNPDMMKCNEEYLYRFEEPEMLATKIIDVFEKEDKIETSIIREIASKRHDAHLNTSILMDVYNTIMSSCV